MKLRPIGDRLIIKRHPEESAMGGIILPDMAKKKSHRGTVLAVGPGNLGKDGTRRPLQVKDGDVVLFTNWAGDEEKDRSRDDEVLVMHEEDILAVLVPA